MPIIRNIEVARVWGSARRVFAGAWGLDYELHRVIGFKPPVNAVFLPPLAYERRVYGTLYHQDPESAEFAFDLVPYADPTDVGLTIEYAYNGTRFRKSFFPVIFGALPGGDELATFRGADGGEIVLQVTRFILAMRGDAQVASHITTEEIDD